LWILEKAAAADRQGERQERRKRKQDLEFSLRSQHVRKASADATFGSHP
jgi:hypothetical protein